jgi:hypothetical protein
MVDASAFVDIAAFGISPGGHHVALREHRLRLLLSQSCNCSRAPTVLLSKPD